jgi:hypothetical protein
MDEPTLYNYETLTKVTVSYVREDLTNSLCEYSVKAGHRLELCKRNRRSSLNIALLGKWADVPVIP